MAQNGSYTINVKMVDNATAVLSRINQSISGQTSYINKLNKSHKALQNELKRLGNATGVTKISDSIKTMSKGIGNAVKKSAELASVFAGVGTAASIAGLVSITNKTIDYNKNLTNNARILGMSASELEKWQIAGRLAGSSSESITNGLKSVGDALQDSLINPSSHAREAFRLLGINVQDQGFKAKSAAEQMGDIADAVKNLMADTTKSSSTKMSILHAMGISDDMLPLLVKGREGLRDYLNEASKYATVSKDGSAADENARKNRERLNLTTEQMYRQLSTALLPTYNKIVVSLQPVLKSMTKWIAVNQGWINTKIDQFIKYFTDTLVPAAKQLSDLIDKTIGWKNILLLVVGIIGLTFWT